VTGERQSASFALDRVALVDCEASSLRQESYPIEIGWCLADTAEVESHLVVPHADWTDWDPEAEAVHGIGRQVLVDQGLPIDVVAKRMRTALRGRMLYADGTWDQRWISRLFDAAGLPGLTLRPFDELLGSLVSPQMVMGSDWLAEELARLKHGATIDEAYARARSAAPPTHRAGADARYLCEVLLQTIELTRQRGAWGATI